MAFTVTTPTVEHQYGDDATHAFNEHGLLVVNVEGMYRRTYSPIGWLHLDA
jgi:selenophosphate synthetase-related protein